MNKIIDLIRIMKSNYSTDIIFFENIVQNETGKFVEIFVENDKIVLYHKVTGSNKGEYIPSDDFNILASAFITLNQPSFNLKDLQQVREIFDRFNIKKQII